MNAVATVSSPVERQLLGGLDAASPWAAILEQMGLAIAVLDADFAFLRVNRPYAVANGKTPDFFPGRGHFDVHPQPTVEAIFRQVRDSGVARSYTAHPFQASPTRGVGQWNWSLTPFAGAEGKTGGTRYLVLTMQEVSASLNAESALRASELRFRRLFVSMTSGFALHEIILDGEGRPCDYRFLDVNPAFEAITGLARQDIVGRCVSVVLPQLEAHWIERYGAVALTGDCAQFDDFSSDLDRHYRVTAYCPEAGQFAVICDDVTAMRDAEARAEFIAYHDTLTHLPNRTLLNIRYQHALDRAQRHAKKLALLIIDLDLFKNINDSLGHEFGDRLLIAVSERFRSRLRDEDTLARLHGDEFALLIEDVEAAADAAVLARDLLRALEQPFRVGDADDIYLGASIGICISPDDGSDPAILLRNADTAVNLAKQQGRKTFRFYTESLTTQALERMSLESRLRKAIEACQLILHYQPLIEASRGAVIGAEALLRWPDPEQGMIAPARFIPVAEDSGLIAPLGAWVLAAACRQMKAWLDAGRNLRTIAVNLSPRQFLLQDVPELIRRTLAETGLDARFLELEITESILIERGEAAVAILKRIRQLGVRLSIDDFGTGYSSLSYLKRFPIDKLKIDQSFVRDITHNAGAAEIVSTIIAMGRSLKLSVLAEGVETPAQLAFLEHHGCDYYQGYLFGRPVAAEHFPESCPAAAR